VRSLDVWILIELVVKDVNHLIKRLKSFSFDGIRIHNSLVPVGVQANASGPEDLVLIYMQLLGFGGS
jgi:hypothetical protein